jgi:uncharacterized protein (DUF58 family)
MRQTTAPLLKTVVLGVLLVACGGLLDAEPLYVPGLALLGLCGMAAAWVVAGVRGLRVQRTIAMRRVVEDQPVRMSVRVTGPRPLPTGAILDELLPEAAPLAVGRRATEVHMVVRFARRGRRQLAPPRVAVRDPLGLMTRIARAEGPTEEVLILPRVEKVRAPGEEGDAAGSPVPRNRAVAAAEFELDGLRQHRVGSPASRIFWPSLAQGGELMERRLAADSDTRPLVVLDPRGAAEDEDVDAAVRAAASLAVHLAHDGGCSLLIPGDRRPAVLEPMLAGWPYLHARLALVGSRDAPSLGAIATRRGPVIYVAAQRLSRPPRALAHAPGGGRLLVVPGAITGRRPTFVVAGCFGYELSDARHGPQSTAA